MHMRMRRYLLRTLSYHLRPQRLQSYTNNHSGGLRRVAAFRSSGRIVNYAQGASRLVALVSRVPIIWQFSLLPDGAATGTADRDETSGNLQPLCATLQQLGGRQRSQV